MTNIPNIDTKPTVLGPHGSLVRLDTSGNPTPPRFDSSGNGVALRLDASGNDIACRLDASGNGMAPRRNALGAKIAPRLDDSGNRTDRRNPVQQVGLSVWALGGGGVHVASHPGS